MKVLVVDDSNTARALLTRVIAPLGGVEVHEAAGLACGQAAIETTDFDAAFIDLRLQRDPENRDGLNLVQVALRAGVTPIIVSGFSDMSEIRAAMRSGAYDYLLKEELCPDMVWPLLETLRSRRALEAEVRTLRSQTREMPIIPELIGSSRHMQVLSQRIERVALSDRPVLVTGPTGSGKELVVRAIHALGRNPQDPVIDLNCGALPAALIESQLFGHEKGAFTGADKKHDGFFTTVGTGTLFLDEIGELPLELQAKLLRVLESRTFRPVGGNHNLEFRGRVVAATHVDLPKRVQAGEFREDLYYRLNVLELAVPSLAKRAEDIPELVSHFSEALERPLTFTEDAISLLQNSEWPGNVRQLRNTIDRISVFAPAGPVNAEVMKEIINLEDSKDPTDSIKLLARRVLNREGDDKLKLMEGALVEEALELAEGNKSAAARILGVHRKVVERRSFAS